MFNPKVSLLNMKWERFLTISLLYRKEAKSTGRFPGLPVEGSIVKKNLHADMLLQQAISQDGHRGEADVVHRQIGRIIQGLGRMGCEGGVKDKGLVRRRRDGVTGG